MAQSPAELRASAVVRRLLWQWRQGRHRVALLLLFSLALVALTLWRSPPADVTSPLSAANGDAHALRWGANNAVVVLDGRKLQRPLPARYPNGASNSFQCDLPSLRFQCDLSSAKGCNAYPQLFPSAQLFGNWRPEETTQIPSGGIFDSICHFNVSDLYEFRLAQMFREMEVPFVAYGVPELTEAADRWTDEYLADKLDPEALYKVHVANDSHFMYYLKSQQLAGEQDPYVSRWMTYPQFVKAVDDVKPLEEAGAPHEYFYFMLKKNDFSKRAAFIYDELPFLSPLENDVRFGDFFVRDAAIAKERGMRCRFGMRGIIAEGHFDGGLNHIAMIRGTKRYVISPPSACKCQGLLTTGQSQRHTAFNWSDVSSLPENARNCPAAEVALTAGEALYLPSYWYHHIVSLDTSIQCNLRSGFTIRDDTKQFLTECGFGPRKP